MISLAVDGCSVRIRFCVVLLSIVPMAVAAAATPKPVVLPVDKPLNWLFVSPLLDINIGVLAETDVVKGDAKKVAPPYFALNVLLLAELVQP